MKPMIQSRTLQKKTITKVMIFLPLLIGAGFLYSRIMPYMAGPMVTLHDTGTETTTTPEMSFSGTVVHGKQLSINGVPLMIDNHGNFTHHIVMQPGFNTFTINASDSFGHSTTITKNFVVQEQVYQSFAHVNSSGSSEVSVIQ